MQYRVDSPVSWLDWALRNTQNQPGTGNDSGVDLSQIEFAVIDGAVQYRQGGPEQPWTVIVRLADIQDGSGATLDDIRAALETAVNSVAVDRSQIVADVTPTFRVISTGLQYKLPADDDWTTIASMPVIKGPAGTPADMTRVTALETQLAAVSGIAGTKPTVTLSVGYGTSSLNALVLGGTQTVTVTLDQTMPTSAYTVKCRATAGITVLSMLTFTVLARTTTTVQIRAAATGVASVAAVLHVNAYQTVVT